MLHTLSITFDMRVVYLVALINLVPKFTGYSTAKFSTGRKEGYIPCLLRLVYGGMYSSTAVLLPTLSHH